MIENDIKNNIVEVETIKLQRVDKIKSRCSSCHRLRVIKNKELNLCSICDSAKKYWGGNNEIKNETKIINNVNEDIDKNEDIKNDTEIETYLCDCCSSKVIYGQQKCHKCSNYLDWRNTKIQDDDNFLICGNCGVILPKNAEKCFNCKGVGY